MATKGRGSKQTRFFARSLRSSAIANTSIWCRLLFFNKSWQKAKIKTKIRFSWVDCWYRLPADIWCDNPVQWPEIKYPDIYDYLINTHGKSERKTQFLVFLFDLLDFSFLKSLIEESQIIITKKLIVQFCQINGFWLLSKLAW